MHLLTPISFLPQQMEEQGLLDIKPAAKSSKSASKKRKQSTGGVGPSPKLPPVRTAPPKAGAGAAAAAYGGPAKKQKLSVRVPGRGTGDLVGHHHAPLPPAPLTFGPHDPLLSPSEMQLFNEVNALLTPTQGGLGGSDWDLLGGLASARGGGTRLGSGGASTAPLTDTPLGQWDMASVFSWFLNGTPTAGGTATTAGPSTAATAPSGDARSGPTPRGPTAAAAAAAAQAMAQPSAQSVAAMIRALSPAVSPSVTPRGGGPAAAGSAAAAAAAAASALMPAPPSRRAAATASAAAAGSGASCSAGAARSQMPDGLTAEMGQRVLLQKLLHLRASGGASAVGGAGGGAGVPLTPFTAAMTEHVFSPLGSRRSPRVAPVRTGGEGATPMVGAAAVSPTFTPSELQLLLSTLGGDNPFAPGIAHDKVAEAQAAAAEELAEGGRRSARAPK